MNSLESDTHKGQKRTIVSINAARNVLRQAHSDRDELEDTRKTGRKDAVSMLDTTVVVKEKIKKLNNINVKNTTQNCLFCIMIILRRS